MNRYELEQAIKSVVEENNMELVDIELRRKNNPFIKIFIYKEDGVDFDSCKLITSKIEEQVDLDSYFSDKYFLEVSSPGLDRKLTNKDDYRRNLGNVLELRTYMAIDGQQEFVGKLVDYNEDEIMLEIDEEIMDFPINSVSLLKRHITF